MNHPEIQPLVVWIDQEAADRLGVYLQHPQEISGLGQVEVIDGEFVITSVHLLEQTVSNAHTTISEIGVLKLLQELKSRGESTESLRFWWHSHANMEPYFSTIDQRTIAGFGHLPWLLSYVGCHRPGQYEARLDIFPSNLGLPYAVTVPVVVLPHHRPSRRLMRSALAEVRRKVTRAPETFASITRTAGYFTAADDAFAPEAATLAPPPNGQPTTGQE